MKKKWRIPGIRGNKLRKGGKEILNKIKYKMIIETVETEEIDVSRKSIKLISFFKE